MNSAPHGAKPGEVWDTLLVRPGDFYARLELLLKTPLGKNQMVTVRIGTSQPFARAYTSYADLFAYMQRFEPSDPDTDIDDLEPLMSIVTITNDKPLRQIRKGTKGTPVKTRGKRK